jgi:PEP-CTERM motif
MVRASFAPKKRFCELIVKAYRLENSLPLFKAKGVFTLRNLGPVVLLVLMLATNSFAAPAVAQSSVIPEPGVLALLGGGLVGLAALIRRHLSD